MKLKIILPALLFLSSIAYSQTLTLNSQGDTTICFTVPQSKYLAKEHYRADAYFKADSICEAQMTQKNLEVKMYKKIDAEMQNVMNNQVSIIKLKDKELKEAQIAIQNANREAKKQKTYKVLSLITGAAISSFLGYKYISK